MFTMRRLQQHKYYGFVYDKVSNLQISQENSLDADNLLRLLGIDPTAMAPSATDQKHSNSMASVVLAISERSDELKALVFANYILAAHLSPAHRLRITTSIDDITKLFLKDSSFAQGDVKEKWRDFLDFVFYLKYGLKLLFDPAKKANKAMAMRAAVLLSGMDAYDDAEWANRQSAMFHVLSFPEKSKKRARSNFYAIGLQDIDIDELLSMTASVEEHSLEDVITKHAHFPMVAAEVLACGRCPLLHSLDVNAFLSTKQSNEKLSSELRALILAQHVMLYKDKPEDLVKPDTLADSDQLKAIFADEFTVHDLLTVNSLPTSKNPFSIFTDAFGEVEWNKMLEFANYLLYCVCLVKDNQKVVCMRAAAILSGFDRCMTGKWTSLGNEIKRRHLIYHHVTKAVRVIRESHNNKDEVVKGAPKKARTK